MKFYRMEARLLSPLLVQENRSSDAPRGLSYLPGPTLRGAIAGHFLRKGGDPDQADFRKIFLDDPVRFSDLLPADDPEKISRPLPFTAHSCKRSPGFLADDGHGLVDTLAAVAATEIHGRPMSEAFVCSKCGQDMKPFPGFWNGDRESPRLCESIISFQRHTGIDRHTDTVAQSIFYITQGIAEARQDRGEYRPQYLTGGVFLTDDHADILRKWLSEPIFAGADKTRGMGEIALELNEQDPPDFHVKQWDRDFREKIGRLTGMEVPSGIYFSLGLTGHLVVVDRFLRPSWDVSLQFPGVVPVLRRIRSHVVRGWQSSWEMPKSEDVAVSMGGVYLFRYEGDDHEGLDAYLKTLQMSGLGLRCSEGFGRITVCDPIHVLEVT